MKAKVKSNTREDNLILIHLGLHYIIYLYLDGNIVDIGKKIVFISKRIDVANTEQNLWRNI